MCETGHSNLTFTTVQQNIAWEYLEEYLGYNNFFLKQLNNLKTAQNSLF